MRKLGLKLNAEWPKTTIGSHGEWINHVGCAFLMFKGDGELHANTERGSTTVQVEYSTLKWAQVTEATAADVGKELKLCWAVDAVVWHLTTASF